MPHNRNRLAFYLLSALLILSSCKGIEDIRITGADNFELKGMENNKLNFSAGIGVINPSSLGFRISEVNLKTSVDGSFLGVLTADDKIKIPAHTDSTYHMDFTMEMANLLTSASTLYNMSRKKQVTVEMQGYVKARSWFTVRKVDVHETRLIDVPSISR